MEPGQNEPKKFTRGLYRGVKVSVKTLNIVIVAGILCIIGLLVYGISNGGFHVTYHSQGGSDVEYQEYQYGELLELPDDPMRQGYVFDGWYLDENYQIPAEENTEVQQDMNLYAHWVKEE